MDKHEQDLRDSEVQLLNQIAKTIQEYINSECRTIVNHFGVVYYTDPVFENLSSDRPGAEDFRYLLYFIIPVDIEDKIVLPKKFYSDTKKFRSYTSMAIDSSAKYERMEYYDNLKNFDQLIKIIESRTAGGKVYLETLFDEPLNDDPSYLVPDVNKLEDVKYLVATFYTN